MKTVWFAAASAVAALTPIAAHAENLTGDPKTIEYILIAKGYNPTVTIEADDKVKMTATHGKAKFVMYLRGCTKQTSCTTLQFYAGYQMKAKPTLDTINSWNRDKRFNRAYIDKDGDPCMEMDVDLDAGGVAIGNFADNLGLWGLLMDQFQKYIGFNA